MQGTRRRTAREPHLALDRQQQASPIQRVLDQLPAHYGSVLEWKLYIDELPVRDIADSAGYPARRGRIAARTRAAAFRDALLAVSARPHLDGDTLSRVLEDSTMNHERPPHDPDRVETHDDPIARVLNFADIASATRSRKEGGVQERLGALSGVA